MMNNCSETKNTGIVEDRGGVPKGSRTSEYYRTKSIPDRFDNPGQYQGQNEFTLSSQPTDWFQGYERKPVHPMYRTTNADYGSRPPSVHTMPTSFSSLSQSFTNNLGECGMYRNHSLNCGSDKSRVPQY